MQVLRDAMRQISQEAEAVVELLYVRIGDEHLDGRTEAEDVRTVLELIQISDLDLRLDHNVGTERVVTIAFAMVEGVYSESRRRTDM